MGTPKTITIQAPKFKKWQRKTDKHRHFVSLDCNFYEDPKIQVLQRENQTATHCYLWILTKLDYETCSWTIREDYLRQAMKTALGKTGNRFNHMALLEQLKDAGLIQFYDSSHDPSKVVLNTSHESPMDLPCSFQGVLEQAETQSYQETFIDKIRLDEIRKRDDNFDANASDFFQNSLFENRLANDTRDPEQQNRVGKEKLGKGNKGKKSFSDESKLIVHELKDMLEQQGQKTFAKDWLLTSYSSCDSLIRQGKSYGEIKEVMQWALTEWWGKNRVNHFKDIVRVYPEWEKSKNSLPRPAYATRGGRYYWDGNPGTDPTFDESIPFELKDLYTQRRWLESNGFFVDGWPDASKLENESLRAYIIEKCQAEPDFMDAWQDIYNRIKAMAT